MARTEKTKRARPVAKRDKLRAAGKSIGPAKRAANNSSGNLRIFFGKIGDPKGYWQRAAKRDGDYKIKLLARMSNEAVYKATFRWDETISASVKSSGPGKLYAAEIIRALRKLDSS